MIDKGDYFQLEPGEKLPDSVKSALFIIADGIEGGCRAYIDVENHKTYIVCGEAKYLGFEINRKRKVLTRQRTISDFITIILLQDCFFREQTS